MPDAAADEIDADRLRDLLAASGSEPAVDLSYLPDCASSNAECLRTGLHASLTLCARQSAGRGRRGNAWHSPASGNIYMSLGIRSRLPGTLLGLLPLQVGVSIAGVLHDLGYAGVGLKWPNDLMFDGRKLGGVLIESRALADGGLLLAVGLGLNCRHAGAIASIVERPVASLDEILPDLDRELLIACLARAMLADIEAFDAERVAGLIADFLRLDGWVGQAVCVRTVEEELHGVYDGIAHDGRLRVAVDGLGLRHFAAADISLRRA